MKTSCTSILRVQILAIETDSGILPTSYGPATERSLTIAARAARKYHNALESWRASP